MPRNSTDVLKLDAWFTPWRFAGLLAILFVVTFPMVVAGFETFYFRDFGGFGYPLAFYHREAFWRGEIPFWNPYNYCGLPFLAQWNTMTLYPPSLFYLVFPLSWSMGMFCLGHLFWGGLGMYFLSYRWTKNRLAASVAGTVFAFNGLSWQALMWPNNSAALGWMPWVILALEKAWNWNVDRGKGASSNLWRNIAVAAVAGAMQMLSGAPEIIILTWLFATVLLVVELVRGEIPRAQSALRFLAIVLLVAGLSAAQLFPFFGLLEHSQRNVNFGDSQWAMPADGWANYLVPLFHTFPEKGVFPQHDQYWTDSYYLGVGTVAFALLACRRGSGWRVWLLAGLGFFSLLMALGEHGGLYSILKHILPLLGFMRFPIKFVTLATFVLPLLAAFGIARGRLLPSEKWPAEKRKILVIGILLSASIALIALCEWFYPKPQDDRVAVAVNAIVRAVFLICILGCISSLPHITEPKLQHLLRIALIMLFWFDVFTHTANPNPSVERSVFEPDTIREYFHWDNQLHPGESRAMQTPASISKISFLIAKDPATDVNGRRLSLYADYNLLDHAAKIDGFYSLELREFSAIDAQFYIFTNNPQPLMDFMSIALVSNPTNAVDWVSRPGFLPLITGGQEPQFVSGTEALREVMSPNFSPVETVFLEPDAQSHVNAHRATAKIHSQHYAPQHLDAEIQADAPAMLVVAQAYFHCWHAYIDGQLTPIWRANYAFQSIEVPSGHHHVEFKYEDSAFRRGAIITLIALCVTGALWFMPMRKVNASAG